MEAENRDRSSHPPIADPPIETGKQAGKKEAGEARPLDLGDAREKLSRAKGPEYWRSLEELADTPEFQEMVHREFPRQASEWPEGVSRRGFLELSAASLALAGLTACTKQPAERIVPYVRQPEELVPGRPLFYATSMEVGGVGTGLLVESHMARPTKVEGNPEHPGSLGATDVYSQASVLGLYDPDRAQVLTYLNRISTWSNFVNEMAPRVRSFGESGGEGLRILTGAVGSPTLGAQLLAIEERFPQARWHQYEAAGRHGARKAAQEAFGSPVSTHYDVSRADVILSLDSDFLTSGPGWVRYARQFARRRQADGEGTMNRFYAVESSPTTTAAQADHRLALPPSAVLRFAAALAAELGVPGASAPGIGDMPMAEEVERWLPVLAEDLSSRRGASLVIPGDHADPAVHVLAHAINQHLGNVGSTVIHTEPIEARAEDHMASVAELAADMKAGRVDTLIILGGNPVYDAPGDLDFAAAMKSVPLRVHHALYIDETSELCHWHIPAAHYLEDWSDTRAFDGTVAPVQPLIEPLFGGRSAHEVLALFGETSDAKAYELVRDHWGSSLGLGSGDGFERAWKRALHDGVLPGTAAARRSAAVSSGAVAAASGAARDAARAGGEGTFELALRPDPSIYDGSFSNLGWLQELPKPLTKLTWDNAVMLSPTDAERLGVVTESQVTIGLGEREVTAPVWVLPGHPVGAATLHLGYGRTRAGRVGSNRGVDAYPFVSVDSPFRRSGVTIAKAPGTYRLASSQTHHDMALQTEEAEIRHLVRHGTVQQYRQDPEFVAHMAHEKPDMEDSMYPGYSYDGYAWGLTVDLSSCVGCNACVVACQSENNIPVVGKEQVLAGREMHWIRIDRYYQGSLEDPGAHMQPVMCMHCEQAPCEVVCPVAATVHSAEGLNEMVYNRCVGTRYCSNNCPYKVRRFNFLLYQDFETETLKMMRNPDVTVRSRGVMEKCTYCVQRISHARIDAKREGRKIADGEVTTACAQACPAEAITFGDINDPESRVAKKKASPLNYGLLEDLNTQPRTTYLAKLSNPNPKLWDADAHGGGHGGGHGDGHDDPGAGDAHGAAGDAGRHEGDAA